MNINEITRDNAVGQDFIAKRVEAFPELTGRIFRATEVHAGSRHDWTNSICLQGQFMNLDSGNPQSLWVAEWEPYTLDPKAAVGRRVMVTACSPHSVVGGVGVVTDVYSEEPGDEMVYVKLDDKYPQGPHSDGRWVISGWQFLDEEPVKDPKDVEIERLKRELERSQERLAESQRYYRHDLGIINEVANEEADNQDWCGTYEDTLDRMNSRLIGGYTLVGRETEWTVECVEEVTVAVRRSTTVTARNADDARERAGEHFDENDLSDDDVIAALREYADPSYHDRESSYLWNVEKN